MKNAVIWGVKVLPIVNAAAQTPAPMPMIVFLLWVLLTTAGSTAIWGIVYIVTVMP